MQLPTHIAFSLEHNDHATFYETVAKRLEESEYHREGWVSEDQKQKAIATNDMWTAHWYPITPIGSCTLHAADLDVLLAALADCE